MESYFYSSGLNGINVDNYISVLLLFFADDLVILADSEIDLNRKLKALNEYCIQNRLTVNINKTKVMIFSKGGYSVISRRHKFYYDSSELDIVPSYVYLGVEFTSIGLFSEMSNRIVLKTKQAFGSVTSLINRSKMNSWYSQKNFMTA